MLVIPITDFTRDVETWLDQATHDEIILEKDGKPYITLSRAVPQVSPDKQDNAVNSLFGVLRGVDIQLDTIKMERLSRK